MKANMNKMRDNFALIALEHLDMLIAAAGYIGNEKISASAEMLAHPSTAWENIASLKTPRSGCAGAALNDIAYVLGGTAKGLPLNSVEMYSPASSRAEWSFAPPMRETRSGFAAVYAGGFIYAMGPARTAEAFGPWPPTPAPTPVTTASPTHLPNYAYSLSPS
jgi:hypothetical protein